jgi:trk system potassium uptake protein TrkA
MRVIVAGCGRVGSQLATLLTYEGHNVVIIDKDPQSFHRLERPFNGLTLTGIAFDEELLKEAGIEETDAFAALTNYDNTNLMAVEVAADLYGVPKVIARVYNPDKEPTYRRMGIEYLCGSTVMAESVHRAVLAGGIRLHLDKGDGLQVLEVDIGREGEGLKLRDLRNPNKLRLLSVVRDGSPLFFSRDTRLKSGDSLLVALDAKNGSLLDRLVPVEQRRSRPRGSMEGARTGQGKEWSGRQAARAIVAGCGRVGAQVAEMLSLDGYHVAVIDSDREAFDRLSKSFHGEVYEGVAFDMETLEKAGVAEASIFLALTNYDNTNLMSAEVARSIYGVGRVISRLYNPDKGNTYQALGIEYICGTALLAEEFLGILAQPRVLIRSWSANNRIIIVDFTCPPRFSGKKVEKLEKEEMLRVGLVNRGTDTEVASRSTVIKKGDTVSAAVLAPRLPRFRRLVS